MGNQSGEKPVSKFVTFHHFTKDKALRKKSIHAIRRDERRHFAITHNYLLKALRRGMFCVDRFFKKEAKD